MDSIDELSVEERLEIIVELMKVLFAVLEVIVELEKKAEVSLLGVGTAVVEFVQNGVVREVSEDPIPVPVVTSTVVPESVTVPLCAVASII